MFRYWLERIEENHEEIGDKITGIAARFEHNANRITFPLNQCVRFEPESPRYNVQVFE
jgi:hypothetical protein